MSIVLIISIMIRLAAMGWSVVLLRHMRDWRMGFLTVMLGLMGLRQILTLLAEKESWTLLITYDLSELPGLAVSILAFLAVFFLGRILAKRKRADKILELDKLTSFPLRIYLLIGSVGLILLIMVSFSFYTGTKMNAKYAPLIDASMEIKLEATQAHLWFEEIISGDRKEDIRVVWEHLDQADWYARAMLEGGKNPEGTFIPLDDVDMRRKIRDVQEKLREFRDITRQRFDAKETAGVGTEIDQHFDAIFKDFINQADKVETSLQQIMAKDLHNFQYLQVMLIVTSIILTLIIGLVVNIHERRRAEDFLALKELNENLEKEVVERQRAEQVLQESEKFFSGTLNDMLTFVAILEPDGKVIFVNNTPLDVAGITLNDVKGKMFYDAFWWQYSEEARQQIKEDIEFCATGETLVHEIELQTAGGKLIWIEYSMHPIYDKEGKIKYLVPEGRDITERKQAEAVLKESEARLSDAQRIAHLGHWDWNIVTNELYWSDEIYRIFGLDAQEFGATYETFLDTLHPEDKDFVQQSVNEALNENKPYSIDHRIVLPSGEVRIVHEQGEVTFESPGKPIRMMGTVQDITERKRAEEHIQHLQSVLKAIRNVNQLIVHEKNLQKLLQNACEILNQTRDYNLVWIGLIQEGSKEVFPAAQVGDETDYLKSLKITWDDSATGKGPTGTAIRTKKPAVMRDIAGDPRYEPWLEEAMKRGYVSSAAVPLVHKNRVFGALNVYAIIPDAFDEEEIELLLEVSRDIAFALHTIELEREHKRIEKELQERREENIKLAVINEEQSELQKWINTFDTFVGKLDPNGIMISCNEAPLKAGGLTKDEMFGKYFPDTKWWSHSEIERAKIIDCFERGKAGLASRIETSFRSADGTPVPIIFNCQPVMDDDGKVKYITAEGKTIVEETQLRNELQKAKDALEIRVRERTFELLEANKKMKEEIAEREGAEQALHQSVREMTVLNTLGQRVSSNLSLDQVVQSALDSIVDSIKPDLTLFFLRDKDKLFIQGTKYKDSKFRHKDTTVHKVGECLCGLAVRKKNTIYSININNDPRCTWTECKKTGLISFAALPLQSGDEIIGVLGLGSAIERDFNEQATFLETASNQIAIGLQNAIFYEQQKDHATKLEQEITERKQAKKALQKAHDELEAKVTERTTELTQANIRLQEIDRLKSEFLATMSHELRTPLNSIIGFTSIIMKGIAGEINEEQKKQLSMVNGSAKHLLSLINDILDLSRIEAGKMELSMKIIKLKVIISEVAQTLSPSISQKGLKLLIEIPEEIPEIYCDKKKVFQILLNLVNNAVKFTDQGEIKIKCEIDNDKLKVIVSDTGTGIKKDNLDYLFEAFRQIDGRAQRRYQGAGLGLFLCKRLVKLLGGDIWAESEYGKGSKFTFTLPLRLKEGK